MLRRTILRSNILVVLCAASVGYPSRTYEYVEQVGDGKEHDTIYEAIAAIRVHNPDAQNLGCIQVYDGTYKEQINAYYGGRDNLPPHCDLIGKGTNISSVVVQHRAYDDSETFKAGIYCEGDNVIADLTVLNSRWPESGYYVQQSIKFVGDGTVENCKITCYHGPAVEGNDHLVVRGNDTDIYAWFGACIEANSTFEIYDCTLRPDTRSITGETPAGIVAEGSGIIDGVTITRPWGPGTFVDTSQAALDGIVLQYHSNPDAVARISNTTIDLGLKSVYHPAEQFTHALTVRGIVLNRGLVVVTDCTINVEGIADVNDPAEPGDDGEGIKVEGIRISSTEGDGLVQVVGNTSISTSKTTASKELEYDKEYLLVNGQPEYPSTECTLGVAFDTVDFNPNGDNEPDTYDEDYVHGIITPMGDLMAFDMRNASGELVAWFDNLGNLFLDGSLTQGQGVSRPATTQDDEFVVQDSMGNVAVINAASGDMSIYGSLQATWVDPSEGSDDFIIRNSNGLPVAYIDEAGNVYLKGGLVAEWSP